MEPPGEKAAPQKQKWAPLLHDSLCSLQGAEDRVARAQSRPRSPGDSQVTPLIWESKERASSACQRGLLRQSGGPGNPGRMWVPGADLLSPTPWGHRHLLSAALRGFRCLSPWETLPSAVRGPAGDGMPRRSLPVAGGGEGRGWWWIHCQQGRCPRGPLHVPLYWPLVSVSGPAYTLGTRTPEVV